MYKKILVTGNGRCNYWNEDMDISYYFSNDESLKSNIKTIQVIIQDTPFSFYTDNHK